MTFRQKIKSHYQNLLSEKINELRFMISDLAQDAQNDAKGSAGDKHETALSMMHLEQEKLTQKLKEVLEQKTILDKIDATQIHNVVTLGSVVKANETYFFVSAALPKITIEKQDIFALSPQSTKIFVVSVSTKKLFPVLPLYKLQKLNICIFVLYSVTLCIFAPNFLNFSSIFS